MSAPLNGAWGSRAIRKEQSPTHLASNRPLVMLTNEVKVERLGQKLDCRG